MSAMTVKELSASLDGDWHIINGDTEVTSIEYDSRSCKAGSAFFCFPGIHADGASYASDAIDRGAVLVVSDRDLGLSGVDTLVVGGNIRAAYAKASGLFWGSPWNDIAVIGVTGTDGKSSTAYHIYQLLKAEGFKAGLSSTVYIDDGTGLVDSPYPNTTPESFDVIGLIRKAVLNGCAFFILEATSHALSDEYERLLGIRYKAAVYTQVSSEHLEFHGSLEHYMEAKLKLAARTDGPVVAFRDNNMIERLEAFADRLVKLDHPRIIERRDDGLDFIHEGVLWELPLPSAFDLDNAFEAACCTSLLLGRDMSKLLPHLMRLSNPKGRQQRLELAGRHVIIDFAHTPDAIDKLLSSYRRLHPGEFFVTLFGASGMRDRSKRPGMGHSAAKWSDVVILTEDDPREEEVFSICREIASGLDQGSCRLALEPDRAEALDRAFAICPKGGFIFSLGLGHQKGISYASGRKEWDEEDALRKAAGRAMGREERSLHVLLLKGGRSPEHDVSLRSAATVRESLIMLGHKVEEVLIGRSGRIPPALFESHADIAWISMHGAQGEDGTVQALLECLGMPYVSENVMTSAVGMDKDMQTRIFKEAGLRTVPTLKLDRVEIPSNLPQSRRYIVKMNHGGSSIGMEAVEREGLEAAVARVLEMDDSVLVQPLLEPLRELETLVMKDNRTGEVHAYGPVEVIATKPYYVYENKYSAASTSLLRKDGIDIDESTLDEIRKSAIKAFNALSGSLYMRVDFFLYNGVVYINEVNTIPGSTPTSHFNVLSEEMGGFDKAVAFLLDSALARARGKRS